MQHEGNAIIGVKDTGVGISAEDQKILFQKYAQIDNAWVSKMRGTGLGLVISKDLIEKMNGKMWVESEVGQGSTFYVSLPMS
jgi:signal transduction histidine kinase